MKKFKITPNAYFGNLLKKNNIIPKNINKSKIFINLAFVYWIIHATVILIFVFNHKDSIPDSSVFLIIYGSFFVLGLSKWIISNREYDFVYTILMVIYSILYFLLTYGLLEKYGRMQFIYFLFAFIALLKLGVSISTLILIIKNKY